MKYECARKNRLRLLLLLSLFSLLFSFPLTLQGNEPEAKGLPEYHLGRVDLRTVFRSLAKLGEFRIILGPTVQGEVTIPLKAGLTARETIELLAGIHGYPCWWEAGTALIGVDPDALGESQTCHYRWEVATEDVIVATLTQVVARDRLQIEAGNKEVHIIANAYEDQNIRELLAEVDRKATRYFIETELVEIDLNQAKEEGLSWALPGSTAASSVRLTTLPASDGERWQERLGSRRLAGARLQTVSDRAGSVFLGDQYPVIISKPNAQFDLIEYQKIGVGMAVTPHLLSGNKTGLTLDLTVNGIGGSPAGDGTSSPKLTQYRFLAQQTLAPGETLVLSGLTFTGQEANALILSQRQEGPAKERTVCLLLTFKQEPGADNFEPQSLVTTETPAPSSEVIHIEIVSGQQPAVVTNNPAATEVLTEVVGLGETNGSSGQVTAPQGQLPQGQTGVEAEPPPVAPAVRDEVLSPVALRAPYRVVKGDTIFSIARKYGVEPSSILRENNIGSSDLLQVGQTIQIPIPPTHLYQLQPKETLWRIAQRYGTTVELLMEINGITDVATLRTDQMLILPVPMDQVINDKY